jgi:hypothetical protein
MSSDTSGAKSPDPFEFLKALWAPMGLPMPGLVTPTLDAAEVEKRIAELKSVESWLNLNLNVLRMTIQGLEMQKATLDAVKGMQGNMADAARVMQGAGSPAPAAAQPSPPGAAMDAWWTVLQQAQKAAADAMGQASNPAPSVNDPGKKRGG